MGVGGNPAPFGLVAVNDDHHRRILRFRDGRIVADDVNTDVWTPAPSAA